MSPREIIAKWLNDLLDGTMSCNDWADGILKALDEQGMAVVPKPRNTPIEELIGFK
jgi:hypothetical protein